MRWIFVFAALSYAEAISLRLEMLEEARGIMAALET